MKPEIDDLNEKLDHVAQTGSCEACKELCGIVRELLEQQELTENSTDNLEKTVTLILREIGVPAHINGYQYLREAILTAVEDMGAIKSVTKVLYPAVAQHFGTTSHRVERSIRHAIEVAWDRGDLETLQKYFGNTVSASKGKTTNSEFIATIADRLRMGGC